MGADLFSYSMLLKHLEVFVFASTIYRCFNVLNIDTTCMYVPFNIHVHYV